MEDTVTVYIGFKIPRRTEYFKRFVAWWTRRWGTASPQGSGEVVGRVCHCEIVTQVYGSRWYRYTVNKYNRQAVKVLCLIPQPYVWMMLGYSFVRLSLTASQHLCMIEFLDGQLNKEFDYRGMVFNFCPWAKIRSRVYCYEQLFFRRTWFCSELTAAALQAACVDPFTDLDPTRLSPNDVLRILRDSGKRPGLGPPCLMGA